MRALLVPAVVLMAVGSLGITTFAWAQPRGPVSGASPPAAPVKFANGPITLDGRLDEADWQAASPIGPLMQQVPREGQPASEPTEVRVLYTAAALYFGVVCHEQHRGQLIVTQLARDANLDVDDRLTIVLDPFLDHRNG